MLNSRVMTVGDRGFGWSGVGTYLPWLLMAHMTGFVLGYILLLAVLNGAEFYLMILRAVFPAFVQLFCM